MTVQAPSPAAALPALASGGLRLRGVTKSFGHGPQRVTALGGVDLEVAPGEFVAVVGGSGCGKSTMLTLAAGNVELALRLRGVEKNERRTLARDLLAKVRLGRHTDKRPHELSGGMKQRVALARVLAQDAAVVLMDEPLGALDAMTRDQMHDLIEDVWLDAGFSVVFVTHNVREAVRLADRTILMGSRPGRIIHEQQIHLPRPRAMDSAACVAIASELTHRLREEVARHDEADYFEI